MHIPGIVISTLTLIEYQIYWSGPSGGGALSFTVDPSIADGPGPGLTDAVMLAAADAYARSIAAVIEAHKPTGSTVSMVRDYQGTAGDGGITLTLP